MPTRPKTAAKAAAKVDPETNGYRHWNEYVQDATKNLKPFGFVLPGDTEPTLLPCPTGDQMEAFGLATTDAAGSVALFGEEIAPRLMKLTGEAAFVVRAKLFADFLAHYKIRMSDIPQS